MWLGCGHLAQWGYNGILLSFLLARPVELWHHHHLLLHGPFLSFELLQYFVALFCIHIMQVVP